MAAQAGQTAHSAVFEGFGAPPEDYDDWGDLNFLQAIYGCCKECGGQWVNLDHLRDEFLQMCQREAAKKSGITKNQLLKDLPALKKVGKAASREWNQYVLKSACYISETTTPTLLASVYPHPPTPTPAPAPPLHPDCWRERVHSFPRRHSTPRLPPKPPPCQRI